jgi:cell fate (sporulation/competence/biofilm development) regulator YlbF (YheA/YmcA/DUF963 family)
MSVETTPAERADELASELGETIADMPAYQEFVDAKAAVESDEELQAQIREFERLREEFTMARQTGEATNEDLRELQETQQELHDRPKMKAYLQAQSEIELKLQELDQLISDPLEIEFGQKAGGCCED